MPTQIGKRSYTEVYERLQMLHDPEKEPMIRGSITTDIVWMKEPEIQGLDRDTLIQTLVDIKDELQLQTRMLKSLDPPDEALGIEKEEYEESAKIIHEKVEALGKQVSDCEILMKSTLTIKNGDETHVFEGYAQEKELPFNPKKKGGQSVNATSFIENCETSARGRALGAAGFGVDQASASADEVRHAQAQEEAMQGQPEEQFTSKPLNPKPRESEEQTLKGLRQKVLKAFKRNEAGFAEKGIDYWLSVKEMFNVRSPRSELSEDQLNALISITEDKDNWDAHFKVLIESKEGDEERSEEKKQSLF